MVEDPPRWRRGGASVGGRGLVRLGSGFVFERSHVLDDGFAPTVDVHPLSVTDPVTVAGYVDDVAFAARGGNRIVRLLVGDDQEAVVALLLVKLADGFTHLRAVVRLAGVDGIAHRETAARGHFNQFVG